MKDYFCGWYLKSQNDFQTLALIPACHFCGNVKSCSLQVITGTDSWNIQFPFSQFRRDRGGISIGRNQFAKWGCSLEIQSDVVDIQGELAFGSFTPITYDIMGPFRWVPFMECRHSVFSMHHRVDGLIRVNGEEFRFDGGVGYAEGDRGRSFPKEYLWTQCCFPGGSLMLSVADIPFCGFRFTGVIGVIWYEGREYRLATYLGAKAVQTRREKVVIRQGRMTLTVRCPEEKGRPLAAPVAGEMKRIIRENAACTCSYYLQENGKTVFQFTSRAAAFEYEYSQE